MYLRIMLQGRCTCGACVPWSWLTHCSHHAFLSFLKVPL